MIKQYFGLFALEFLHLYTLGKITYAALHPCIPLISCCVDDACVYIRWRTLYSKVNVLSTGKKGGS